MAQFVWVNSEKRRTYADIVGTVSHEATHYVDHLESRLCKEGERLPGEIKARMVQTIVVEFVKLIEKS